MGEVYLAHDDRLDRPVAIKRIRHDVEATSERRERLRREAQAVAKLNHPAVVQIHDVVFDDDCDAIVMERVLGESLDRLMLRGGLPGAHALELARQIAGGLEAAHHRGLVHRDLKAENVMVTPEGKAKILDFGLVKELKPLEDKGLTAEGVLVGTSRSMSPEQALGLPVDSRSDLFSFGVLCYELFTGHSPFRGGNFFETLDNITRNHPPPPKALRPELPTELSELIEKLLEKDPGHRLKTAGEVLAVFDRLTERGDLEGLAAPRSGEETFREASPSTAPTGSWIQTASTDEEFPTLGTTEPFPRSALPPKRRDFRWLGLGLVLLVTLGIWWFRSPPEAEGVSVLVPKVEIVEPKTDGPDEAILLLAAGVRAATLGTLSSLSGVSVIEPHRNSPEDELEAARSEAADQVLQAEIVGTGGLVRITLQRVDTVSGQLIAASALEVSSLPQHGREVATLLQARLQGLFAEYPPPPEDRLQAVSAEAYRTFLELRLRADRGDRFDRDDLNRAEQMIRDSPQFLEGVLFAAFIANAIGEVQQARELAIAAEQLAPTDPRPLFRRVRIELEAGRNEDAERAVETLEAVAPGDILSLVARAALYKHRSRLKEARSLQEMVVQLRPSWQNLYELADIEYTLGDYDSARKHLALLLTRSPDNPHALGLLARLELFFGDLSEAESIYKNLITTHPNSAEAHLGNLGLSRYLQGHFDSAVDSYRQALEQGDSSRASGWLLELNLANALDGQGDRDQASSLWRKILEELRAHQREAEPKPYQRMMEAECLARLGEMREAVAVTQETLRAADNPSLSYQAALVYALTGDRTHALLYSEKALKAGIRPRWFRIPAFAGLLEEPELQALLGASA